ncbi:MAG: peptidyl-prolyl cis-trans isomerase D [Bacteroidia bacterium]|jgi:peptidyl-prolyl cis-trans isomerase D|tara:strand:- start:1524 stop:3662 length:2139 start_codon:yes stop_codon:yes gene_type:complete
MPNKYNNEEQSVLQKIQNQTGCLLLVIGVAMLAFVLTDLVSSGTSIFGSDQNSVGEINGESVSYEEYNGTFEGIKAQLLQNNPGLVMDESITKQYRDQAWNMLVESKTIEPEYKKLGINVSSAELEDLTIGANTHPQIMQSFQNPETGQFEKTRLVRFLKEDINSNPDAMASWTAFQGQFTNGLIAEKYQKLIVSSFYATELQARNRSNDDSYSVNASIVSLPYAQLTDSSLSASDADILAYAKKNRANYEQDASRDIEYVKITVVPSAEDSSDMLEWASETAKDFAVTKDDSVFVSVRNSETPFNPAYQVRGSFAPEIENVIFNAELGKVVGPFQKDGVYSVFKVISTGTDTMRSVKASHIVFPVAGADSAAAIKTAQETLAKIRSGETTFEQEASNRNYDATRTTGGDMGWVREDNRAYPKRLIAKLVSAGQGSYVIVPSNRGVHLAKTTSAVSRKSLKVAIVDQSIYPSTKTDGDYYKKAGELLTKVNSEKSFEEVAEELGLTKRVANRITEDARAVPGFSNSNKIAQWLFNAETEEGTMSDILDLDGNYVVAKVAKVRDAGLPAADDLRTEVEVAVLNKKKAAVLIPKMEKALESTKTADELAQALNIKVNQAPAISLNTGSIPYVGQDNKLVGSILGTAPSGNTGVVDGENAVSVAYVNAVNTSEPTNLEAIKDQVKRESSQAAQGGIRAALTKKAEVKDQRYRFYD